METEIDRLLSPQPLYSLREDVPPVQCMIWKGRDQYDTVTFDVYPFDTLETIKTMICNRYSDDSSFVPRFTFVGVPQNGEEPSKQTTYLPLDYLWYGNGTHDPTETHVLFHPLQAMTQGDEWFVTANGTYSSPNMESRGRSTLEDVFLKPHGSIPTLHVFSLVSLLREYKGATPISEVDWNKRFAGYFPHVPLGGPYQPVKEDIAYSRTLRIFLSKRAATMERLNQMIEGGELNPGMELNGVRHMNLTWKKPVQGFEGAASMFYRLRVTEKRPCIRLLPMDGAPVSKIHVRGVLPIPTLEDPRILESWGKETSPDPTMDVCTVKYVHRPSIGTIQPIYGTIQILNDGTMNLVLQPPKQIKKLNPRIDFSNFRRIVEDVFQGLPQSFSDFAIHDISVTLMITLSARSKKFTTERLVSRLATFQTLFTRIDPLPNESPILSLRYKAVSQYASESNVFQLITQYAMQQRLAGEEINAARVTTMLQEQFQFTPNEAAASFKEWLDKRGAFTLQQPEEGEFIESFHPGIDLHIYDQHPSYYISINRINSEENYRRLFTTLSVLLLEDDGYFTGAMDEGLDEAEHRVETNSIQREEENDGVPVVEEDKYDEDAAIDLYDNLYNEPDEEEKKVEPVERVDVHAPVAKPTSSRLVNPTSWFITKLQEIDARLFKFTPAGSLGYTRQCAGNEDRQPAVLTKEQYQRMRLIYKNDPVFWIEYPLMGKADPVEPMGTDEVITVMRYGSDANHIHYYFCPQYFCLVDELMIRPKDFEGKKDREGHPKPSNTCPFCQGRLITNRKKIELGASVIKRKNAQEGTKHHKYIRFLKKSSHPEKLAMPCCFVSPISEEPKLKDTLRITGTIFEPLREALQEEKVERIEPSAVDYGEMIYPKEVGISYASQFLTLHRRTILEANKQLEPGSFAMATPALDSFFQQHSADQIVKRVTMQLKLRPYAEGFLRIGTENTYYESLLGVLAPLLFLNTIHQVKERILQTVVPKIFLNANFGNLVLEMYDPRDGKSMPATPMELRQWTQQNLGISTTANNMYALLRIYNAYHRFVAFMNDSSQRKDLRHLQPLLAEPGLFRPNGLQLIIMEETDTVRIKCPIFGVSMDRNRLNEFAFVSRTMKPIPMTTNQFAHYELYLYTENKAAKGGQGETHDTILRWNHESRRYWPSIVKKRVDEYMTQCQSRYRTLYTPQPIVNPMAMVPLSKAVEASPSYPEGIIKDSYNHLVGLTFRIKAGSSQMVVLPVIDDGVISISSSFSIKNIYLDEEDVKLAPAEEAVAYYKKNFESLFALYPGYRVKSIARKKLGNQVVALQLENGIYVPVAPPREEATLQAYPVVSVGQFQWQIDKALLGKKWNPQEKGWGEAIEEVSTEASCGTDSEAMRISSYRQWEESYQQFRLMVSNWLTSERAGPLVRKGVEEIIFNENLPEYERRKRLYLYLSAPLLTWFYPDADEWDRGITSFLRKDCQLIDQPDACTGSCHWKQEEGKCLLHVTETTELGDNRAISTPELYTKRVIDELVRFPGRRKQLLRREVSQVTSMVQAIREGDQYILPESSPTWTNLLRMDWAKSIPEEAKYYEEHSREEKEERAPLEGELPPALQEILGADTRLRLLVPPSMNQEQPLLPFTSIFGLTLNQLGLPSNAAVLTQESMVRYVKTTALPIGIINLMGAPEIQFLRPMRGTFDSVMILVFLPGQAGLLVEELGVPTVKIGSLSEAIRKRWVDAALIPLPIKKIETTILAEKEPLRVQAKRAEVKRRPRMAH